MWIKCENGRTINSDYVAVFQENNGFIEAEMVGYEFPTVIVCKSKHYNIDEIIKLIISGEKYMEV